MLNVIAGEVVRDVLDELKVDVADYQRSFGGRDTGASADSLRVAVVSTDTTISGQLWGFERLWIQDKGRGPNKSGKPSREQVEGIKKWAKRHGMKEEAAWPIAIKQAKKGTPVPNENNPGGVISKVLTAENVKQKLTPRLKLAILKGFKDQLFNGRNNDDH